MPIWDDVKKYVDTKWDAVDTAVGDMDKNRLPYTALLQTTLQGLRMTTASAVSGFTHGDTMGGVGGVLGMVGSLLPLLGMAGPAAGTLGVVLGGIFDIVGSIVAAFGPKAKSLRQELEEALGHLHAQLIHDEVVGAMRDLERATAPLERVTNGSRSWETMQSGYINMVEGNASHQLGVTRSWLEKAENQQNPEWVTVFEAFWCVVALRTMVFAIIVNKLDAQTDAVGIGANALLDRYQRDRSIARGLYDVALNKGTLWHIGNYGLYERDSIVTNQHDTNRHDHRKIFSGGERIAVGPYSKHLYVLDGGWVRVRDDVHNPTEWRPLFPDDVPQAIDLWVAPRLPSQAASHEPSDDEDAIVPADPERIVVVSKGGAELRFGFADTKAEASTITVNEAKIRQFRSLQRSDGIHYFLLGAPSNKANAIYYMPEEEKGMNTNRKRDVFLFPIWNMAERRIVELNDDLLGIALGKDELGHDQAIAYSKRTLYARTFPANYDFSTKDDQKNWTPLPRPEDEDGDIHWVVGSRDAHLLVVFGDKMWAFAPKTTVEQNRRVVRREWKREGEGEMKWVAMEPVAGFDLYNACRTAAPTTMPLLPIRQPS